MNNIIYTLHTSTQTQQLEIYTDHGKSLTVVKSQIYDHTSMYNAWGLYWNLWQGISWCITVSRLLHPTGHIRRSLFFLPGEWSASARWCDVSGATVPNVGRWLPAGLVLPHQSPLPARLLCCTVRPCRAGPVHKHLGQVLQCDRQFMSTFSVTCWTSIFSSRSAATFVKMLPL